MKYRKRIFNLLIFLIIIFDGCQNAEKKVFITSPDGKINVEFILKEGKPYYVVNFNGEELIDTSALGYIIKRMPSLNYNFEISSVSTRNFEETWNPVIGDVKSIENHFYELRVSLHQLPPQNRKLDIIFRVFNDGVAFRYEIPSQVNFKSFEIIKELSQFNFKENLMAWWIPADFDSYGYLYRHSLVSDIKAINTPVTIHKGDSLFVCIHEAQLVNYPAMALTKSGDRNHAIEATLSPWPDKILVKTTTPMRSPWRTIQIAESAAALAQSHLILNLNDPCRIRDLSFIKPMKYIGIRWSLITGKETWESGKNHGATTQNVKKYIDFAANNNIQAVLVEGWNTGWENLGKENAFDHITPNSDFNWVEIMAYAKENEVEIIAYNETGGDVYTFERNISRAFALYNEYGVNTVKIGYQGKILSDNHNHFGQWMVNHYLMSVKVAADHRLMVDIHDQVHETGLSRTYPNLITTTGFRDQIWNSTAEGNTPEYLTLLPFTRLMAGPADYGSAIFNLWFHGKHKDRKIQSTLACQLALMVVIYSPMLMAGDMIENYDKKPGFQFIRDLEINWVESKVLDAKLADYVCIARKSGDKWFLGAITDENSRNLEIPLGFLDEGSKYIAKIYADGDGADFQINPNPIEISSDTVDLQTVIKMKLARGGGQAISFEPILIENK